LSALAPLVGGTASARSAAIPRRRCRPSSGHGITRRAARRGAGAPSSAPLVPGTIPGTATATNPWNPRRWIWSRRAGSAAKLPV